MRILSQEGLRDGIIDVPYEQVSIEQKENEIWCGYSSTMDRHCVGKCFAKYSTEAKTRKAMEMLRRFSETRGFSNIPNIIIDNKEFFEMLKKSFLISYEEKNKKSIIPDVTITLERYSNYFQFPQDNEIEV